MKKTLLILTLIISACSPQSSSTLSVSDSQSGVISGAHAKKSDAISSAVVGLEMPGGHCTGVLIASDVVLTAAHCARGGMNSAVARLAVSDQECASSEVSEVVNIPENAQGL